MHWRWHKKKHNDRDWRQERILKPIYRNKRIRFSKTNQLSFAILIIKLTLLNFMHVSKILSCLQSLSLLFLSFQRARIGTPIYQSVLSTPLFQVD